MGIVNCCKKTNSTRPLKEISQEKEISFPSYSSKFDHLFVKTEKNFNLWKELQFGEFIPLIIRFSPNNVTVNEEELPLPKQISHRDPFFNQSLDFNYFQSFVENKILKHKVLYEKAGQDELLAQTFMEVALEMYKSLQLKLDQFYGEKKADRLTKGHVILYGLLYCTSTNISKVKFLFDLFSNESNLFVKSSQLDDFILSLFLMASYCTLAARKKASNFNDKIEPITQEDLKNIIDCMELKDAMNLLKVYNETFFNEKTELTYEEMKANFSDKQFGWLFNPRGIRNLLEKNNV